MTTPKSTEAEKSEPQSEPRKNAGDPLEEKKDPAKKPAEEEPDTFERVYEKGRQMGF